MSCSIILCTYNGASKLEATLKAITELRTGFDWELLLIDNNSTDSTADFARSYLANSKIDYSVLDCNTPGKMKAFWLGIRAAKYDFILDCDDDNHLFLDFLQVGISYLKENPRVGALGGHGILKAKQVPDWFETYAKSYAIGSQGKSGEVMQPFSHLYGAGCFYRKSILLDLESKGFYSLLSCRKGTELSSGGDVELCYAIQLSGFDLVYLNTLKFHHAISQDRLSFEYYLKLKAGIASSFPILDSYRITEFLNVIAFNNHLIFKEWIALKGLLKSTLLGNSSMNSKIEKVVTVTKFKYFFKNYTLALEGFKRNQKIFK
ncbi:glycosyltransferase [Algoriphagus marinus]|uniref:glycosyltransferase n=1 Tax=Algoriphagus marinus TaxID=1925762 RepID=UPI00094BBE66|nr:glycosyltransferase [Algoriphagus marinus]